MLQPELTVKIWVGRVGAQGLHDPSYGGFAELVQVLGHSDAQLLADEGVSRDMDLFVSADVGTHGAASCVSVPSEEGEQYEKHGPLKHHGLEHGMLWRFDPSLLNGVCFGDVLELVCFCNVIKSKVMLLFVLDVGLKKFFGFDREVFLQCTLDEITDRDLQVAEGQSPKQASSDPSLNLPASTCTGVQVRLRARSF